MSLGVICKPSKVSQLLDFMDATLVGRFFTKASQLQPTSSRIGFSPVVVVRDSKPSTMDPYCSLTAYQRPKFGRFIRHQLATPHRQLSRARSAFRRLASNRSVLVIKRLIYLGKSFNLQNKSIANDLSSMAPMNYQKS